MAYLALEQMREINKLHFGQEISVEIPKLPSDISNYGLEALLFLRNDCENLKFESKYMDLKDFDGRSVGIELIPYNMERDLDRLSFERAILRFLKSGSREDAFDIYYCYCEIFHPFGGGYQETGILLRMLSEHEHNASSLLMKHRDHYSHSVYVFCIGLAMYRNHKRIRDAYNARFELIEGPEAACHFLEYWGMTSLFHDVGYPFEIAHQQMKAYIGNLSKKKENDKINIDKTGFAPYISYKGMDLFSQSRLGDLNDFFAQIITDRLELEYLSHTDTEPYLCRYKLQQALKDRAVHDNPGSMDYLYMDHAYFSGMILAKTYLEHNKQIDSIQQIPKPMQDSLCAIILHNSLFRFTVRKFLDTKKPLSLKDRQPLAYLLMLCDELQCWNRIRYGKITRHKLYPFDFDMFFPREDTVKMEYLFDKAYENWDLDKSSFDDMNTDNGNLQTKTTLPGRIKFLDDIDEIVALSDVISGFARKGNNWDCSQAIEAKYDENKIAGKLTMSDGSYLSLYQFAIALHGRYCDPVPQNMEAAFEKTLSLEYKLSNIAQAKDYAYVLEKIHCFYTDRAVYYVPVLEFTPEQLNVIANEEHKRWCAEKKGMGWIPGSDHLQKENPVEKRRMRECTRRHDLLGSYVDLQPGDQAKNSEPMKTMLELLYKHDGLTIYKLPIHTGSQSAAMP